MSWVNNYQADFLPCTKCPYEAVFNTAVGTKTALCSVFPVLVTRGSQLTANRICNLIDGMQKKKCNGFRTVERIGVKVRIDYCIK